MSDEYQSAFAHMLWEGWLSTVTPKHESMSVIPTAEEAKLTGGRMGGGFSREQLARFLVDISPIKSHYYQRGATKSSGLKPEALKWMQCVDEVSLTQRFYDEYQLKFDSLEPDGFEIKPSNK